jgi:hypothetical protein
MERRLHFLVSSLIGKCLSRSDSVQPSNALRILEDIVLPALAHANSMPEYFVALKDCVSQLVNGTTDLI